MKPITLENLRRLMGGGRKKKDRNESSFKRSESFKRISIRKNYLERGGRGRNPLKAAPPPPVKEAVVEVEVESEPPQVIGYGQWIECLHAEDYGKIATTASSSSKSTSTSPPPPPVPPPRRRHESNSLEILRLEKSPEVRRRFRSSKDERSDSALSVSLGRIWMDAPLAMANAPRSLELPRPSSSSVEADPGGAPRRAHHSLDSALKEKRDDPKPLSARSRAPAAVCRTLSSTTQTDSTGKTLSSRGSIEPLSSSKDSGFSFSVSPPPTGGKSGGFFRKKKKNVNKPKLSVSREGYFKRTSVSVAASSSESVKGGTARSDLYQVVVGRPPRSLRSLKLDPLIFVPPEKRSVRRSASRRYEVHEIRDYCTPRDLRLTVDDDEDEGLYECISGPDNCFTDEEEVLGGGEVEDEEEPLEEVVEEEDEEEEEYRVRKPVRRRKSRKTVKYVAKIHRAPSTLKRNHRKKCE